MQLNKILKCRGLTVKQLSEQTGIKYRTMLKYSCGERKLTVDAAKIIGKALNINWWLFFEEE
ncbi:helix-turn-helix domain-containing protein [Anaerotignum propionicum]|uniref:helix-turn-helix domain-containing protein n=1 Tax=Anaerotignum propionicum TaxID=28446 RepID=UPI00210DD950|nr:helix-turn-helix transcriptional regulator [Anaerotignum propionicum]MCQ4935001.1 helix-turn-helix transcriptional regulator [Anaerotignum propionicum]